MHDISKAEFLGQLASDVEYFDSSLNFNNCVVPDHLIRGIAEAEGIKQLALIEEAWEFYLALIPHDLEDGA